MDWFPEQASARQKSSLIKHGVLQPLSIVSCETSGKFQIIDGFKRFRAMKELCPNQKKLQYPCVILPSTLPTVALAELRLSMLSSLHNLKGVEVCRILLHLKLLGFSEQKLAEQILPEFQLKASLHRVKQYLDLGEQLKSESFSESLSTLTAEDLLPMLRFSKNDFSHLLKLSHCFSVGGKKWKGLLQLLYEVCRLRECTLEELLNLPEVTDILNRAKLQGPVRYRILKQQLEHWRYPEWSMLRDAFEKQHQKLRLPHEIHIHGDDSFEQEHLSLSFKATSTESLKQQWATLWSEKREQNLQQLFQIQQGKIHSV